MKFWFIDIMQRVQSQTSDKMISKQIYSKKCMSAQESNVLFKEMKEKYPAPEYQVYRENREN